MKKYVVSAVAVLSLVSASLAFACTEDGQHGIAPDNNLYIPDSAFGAFPVTEAQFNNSIARATKIYEPIFAAQGRTYKVIPKWSDGTVNAFADRAGTVSQVHMFGGLARHPNMSPDGFELVICHETGHHLGGAPKIKSIFGKISWASNEGEADYYATLKCARMMWANDDNETIVAKMTIPQSITERCQKSFDKANDLNICKRAAIAGKDLGDTLASLGKSAETDFDKPDTSVVTKMVDAHPAAQCRLDTYIAGSFCAKPIADVLSDTDSTAGTCSEEKGETLGIRPTCWYKVQDRNAPPKSGSSWPSGKISRR
jgi:hypothetical protein